MKKQKDFKKELIRDFLSFGSWIFYVLVVARAMIKPYRPFVDQMIIAGLMLVLIYFLSLLIKQDYDSYIARGLILAVFTSLFYKDKIFTTFAIIIFAGLVASSYFVNRKKQEMFGGIVIGGIITSASYYLSGFSANMI